MTRERMRRLVAGDKLVWKVDRNRTLTVLQTPWVFKNGVVKVAVRWDDPNGGVMHLTTSSLACGPTVDPDAFESVKDVMCEKEFHIRDFHKTDAADVVFDWSRPDWVCKACGMVIDGNGNGCQSGRLG